MVSQETEVMTVFSTATAGALPGPLVAMSVPIIETPRLILRPLRTSDEPEFLALAGDWQVARMTSDIPHPLLPAQARAWLKPVQGDVRFAIDLHGLLIGSAGYFRRRSGVAELGFWLGRQHWGLGIATEAAGAVVRHGFAVDGHTAFSSAHFADNAASRRVLGKLGFEEAGLARMWCSARGVEVDAVTMWLSRERADTVLGSMGEVPAPVQEAGHNRFSRWLDQARRAIRDHTRT
jgi:RimJ/RimL family protein N-acetyltransferase